jgi:RNA polymerase sigma-70 factor (ECF subfamily)
MSPNARRLLLEDATARHRAFLRNLAFRYLRNYEDAEDVVQEALLAAWQHLDTYRGESKFTSWLGRIVINLCLMRIRRTAVAMIPLEVIEPYAKAPEPDPMRTCMLAQAYAWLQKLPAIHRITYSLHIDGMTYREIADCLGIPAGTAKARVSRTRRLLAERYGIDQVRTA